MRAKYSGDFCSRADRDHAEKSGLQRGVTYRVKMYTSDGHNSRLRLYGYPGEYSVALFEIEPEDNDG